MLQHWCNIMCLSYSYTRGTLITAAADDILILFILLFFFFEANDILIFFPFCSSFKGKIRLEQTIHMKCQVLSNLKKKKKKKKSQLQLFFFFLSQKIMLDISELMAQILFSNAQMLSNAKSYFL